MDIIGASVEHSFTPMQLDVFHPMWDLHHDEAGGARPQTAATRVERDTLDRAHAQGEVLVGTMPWKEFVDQKGKAD